MRLRFTLLERPNLKYSRREDSSGENSSSYFTISQWNGFMMEFCTKESLRQSDQLCEFLLIHCINRFFFRNINMKQNGAFANFILGCGLNHHRNWKCEGKAHLRMFRSDGSFWEESDEESGDYIVISSGLSYFGDV